MSSSSGPKCEETRVIQALLRPVLWMGCEREGIIALCFVSGVMLAINAGMMYQIFWNLFVFGVGLPMLRKLNAGDPFAVRMLFASLVYPDVLRALPAAKQTVRKWRGFRR